jgi:1,5-anhydro-D-fructose reductase (1,5-anhydro-D-mannitol-forming)
LYTVRWGIVGCGDVTEVKSGPGFQQAVGSSLVAVMRRNGDLARDYAERHSVPFWTDNAEEIIHHPDVDIVYIATPPGSHLEYGLKVAAAGKPAYIEKPMARSYAECETLVDAFAKAQMPLFVAFYRRGLVRFRTVQALVQNGDLGEVTSVNYRFASDSHRRTDLANLPWRLVAEESGGGLFLDLGCHTLDILDFILGPLESVLGRAANVGGVYLPEDSLTMEFRTQTGALGTASWNFVSGVNEDIIEITGTQGRVSLSTFSNDPVTLITAKGTEMLELTNPRHIQGPMIQMIVDELRGAGYCPSTGVSGARTARVMDTVLDSYYGGRGDAFWDRPETWPGLRTIG